MTRRKILFLTGTRADFGKLKPLMREVDRSERFECFVFATGMHTLPRYGLTVNEIKKENFQNVFSHMNQDSLMNERMEMILANTVQGLGHFVQEFPADLLVVHGDRVEALAGAIVGAFNNILTAHVEGGEVSGTVDELIRHAVTKLSHLHFVSNETSKRRLIQLGERPATVHVIGSPDVDIMLSDALPAIERVRERYEIPFDEYSVFVYHPVTSELDGLAQAVGEVVGALCESSRNFVVIYPNNDPGSNTILGAIRSLEGNPRFRVLPSMRFEYFLSLLKSAQAIVGNSSAGIHEAPVYGVPTVNIGTRQHHRSERASVVDVPDEKRAILEALDQLPARFEACLEFGRGDSAERFMRVLNSGEVWQVTRQKCFRDVTLGPDETGE
jgi:UDP-N-acetylglucosamine 2-epimerase (hydrolysing)